MLPAAPAHRQASFDVRLEWGPTGGAAVCDGATYAVVVDVLSFTTTLCVALERGATVWPFAWRDERAVAFAADHDALLAVGRLEQREAGVGVSLSPAAMAQVEGVGRLVLPSPNGSAIAAALVGTGVTLVGACLRNADAVASRLAERLGPGEVVAVVAAGERWPDGSLRPALEDIWGAGAVVAGLRRRGVGGLSPEASYAADAFCAVADRLADLLPEVGGGRELVAAGFADDVTVAADLDSSAVVPVLGPDGAFVDRGPTTPTPEV